MSFASLEFGVLMVAVFMAYWTLLRRSLRAQNALLLLASLAFYGWWDWRFLALLAGVILVTWLVGLRAGGRHGRAWMWAGIAADVGVLVAFKYFNFFGEQLRRLAGLLGWEGLDWLTVEVLLPVGLSFYTFQSIAYMVDVRRGRVAPCRRLDTLALFIAFFPQLVAGPIERAGALLPQLERQRRWDRARVALGARQMLWGLVKKVAIADVCAVYVTGYLDVSLQPLTPVRAAVGMLLFTVQIYCDFSGYCDIARGAARCLGIDLMQNFRYPLFATDVREFWRRWNTSLMLWLRDYVYIPLGGSRRGPWRRAANVMVTFTLSGLWHGAAATFVVWGACWGMMAAAYGATRRHLPAGPRHGLGRAATLLAVVCTFGIFRSATVAQAWQLVSTGAPVLAALAAGGAVLMSLPVRLNARSMWLAAAILTAAATAALALWPATAGEALVRWYVLPLIAGMLVVEWYNRRSEYVMQHWGARQWVRTCVYCALIALLLVSGHQKVPFIYFQF